MTPTFPTRRTSDLKAKYDLDESEGKPYLQLDKLTQGMFWAAGQLYDLGFKENTGTIPVFDPKVRTFEVYNLKTNENVGVFYLDNFARDGKIGRASCRERVSQYV